MHPLLLSIASFLLTTVPILSASAQTQYSYPQDVVNQYIEDCTAGRGAQARQVCVCTINELQATYSFEDFQIFNQQVVRTNKLPIELSTIIKACEAKSK